MSKQTATARRDARTAGKTAKNNSTRRWRKTTRSRGYGRTADDCMDFYHAMSGYHQYMIRTEARAEGITVVQYLRREIPLLIEEGRQAIREKNCGRVAA
ncbi:MAG: hypothetical protein IJG84_21260 [Kiritimatiellae bacterium]|nr:hypothetical protein [Kiritimatiellia bacterium]